MPEPKPRVKITDLHLWQNNLTVTASILSGPFSGQNINFANYDINKPETAEIKLALVELARKLKPEWEFEI